MPFEVIPVSNATAEAILVWCGVTSPTPTDTAIAVMAATAAEDTIRSIRRLNHAAIWRAEHDYVLGDIVAPSHANEHIYKCTTAGTTSDTAEPTWPTTTSATVADGTVVWTEYVRPIEAEYAGLAIEMGVYAYQKRGVDGVIAFSENGVARSYEKGSFPPSLVSRITPLAKTG